MTDHPNVVPLRHDDRRMIYGQVDYVELRAMPDGPRLAVLRDRQISVCRRCRGAIAIAFLRHNAIALTLGFIAGLLAVLVPALVIAQVVS